MSIPNNCMNVHINLCNEPQMMVREPNENFMGSSRLMCVIECVSVSVCVLKMFVWTPVNFSEFYSLGFWGANSDAPKNGYRALCCRSSILTK